MPVAAWKTWVKWDWVPKPTSRAMRDEAESFTKTRDGRTYNNLYHFLFLVRDGKVAGVKEYLDTMHTNAVLCTP